MVTPVLGRLYSALSQSFLIKVVVLNKERAAEIVSSVIDSYSSQSFLIKVVVLNLLRNTKCPKTDKEVSILSNQGSCSKLLLSSFDVEIENENKSQSFLIKVVVLNSIFIIT